MRKEILLLPLFLAPASLASSDSAKVAVEASPTGLALVVETPSGQLLAPDVVFIDAGGRPTGAWLSSSTALEAAEDRYFFGELRGWVGIEYYVVQRIVSTSWHDALPLTNRAYFFCSESGCEPQSWTAFAVATGFVVQSTGPDGPELLSALTIGGVK